MRSRGSLAMVAALASLACALELGCAYYNTFYLARRYYTRSLADLPYAVDKSDLSGPPQFDRSVLFSKKVIEQYPKSKWVDDAYLLWAKALLANDDPRESIRMLEDFDTRYPKSPVAAEATFYLGVSYLRARKYERGLHTLDDFLARAPRHALAPFAYLERARALLALERPDEAAQSAGAVVDRYSRSVLARRARIVRAEALIASRAFDRAREDYRTMGKQATTDEDRLTFLLKESECLEGARQFDAALGLLKDALAHEREPILSDTTGGRIALAPTTPGADRYGRLLTHIGTVHLRAGRLPEALTAYRRVVADYPRTQLAAEAQYRIGYAYETEADDFDKARAEYAAVREHGPGTSFSDQAASRSASLERLAQFRKSAGGDTISRAAEAQFLLAEQYLFELDKPQRALEQYRKIESDYPGTPYAAKAINAQAWVLSRKLKRQAEADSLFWKVVREHAGTEAQLAARDYLEYEGVQVPEELIKLPEPTVKPDSAAADTGSELTPPPPGSFPLGTPPPAVGAPDTTRLGIHPPPSGLPPIPVPPRNGGAPRDTSHTTGSSAPRDTSRATGSAAPRDTSRTSGSAAPRDTSHATGSGAPRDTSRATAPAPRATAPGDTTRSRR